MNLKGISLQLYEEDQRRHLSSFEGDWSYSYAQVSSHFVYRNLLFHHMIDLESLSSEAISPQDTLKMTVVPNIPFELILPPSFHSKALHSSS